MSKRKAEIAWLGAEALPGDLAEINRVNQAWLNGAGRQQRFAKAPRALGFVANALRWMKGRSPSTW